MLGLCGVARCGKDTFFHSIRASGATCNRIAFADALKSECDDFLLSNIGISAFTSEGAEKEIIRPFLVTYGTHLRRRLDRDCWVKKVEPKTKQMIHDGILPVVTDVRYKNEADWIHKMGGKLIHISRTLTHGERLHPANPEEAENDPILKLASDAAIKWDTFTEELLSMCKPIVKKCLANFQIIN